MPRQSGKDSSRNECDLRRGDDLDAILSIIVPAWNEERRLRETLQALQRLGDGRNLRTQLIVVDDGSTDKTAERASGLADRIVRHPRRLGKGAALESGMRHAEGGIILFADADLGGSAVHLARLLEPIAQGKADMAIARFAQASAAGGGFGFVKRLAARGIYGLTGLRTTAPLSGQRAITRELLHRVGRFPRGFGIEVGLTIDAARLGFRICEVPLPLAHRETGRTLAGFCHRGRQFLAVGKTILHRWARSPS